MKIKVSNSDFFGMMNGVSLKGERLHSGNIRDYDLIKVWEDNTQEVFKIKPSSSVVIVLDKKNHSVDWYDDDHKKGQDYDGFPDEFFEEDRSHWIKLFTTQYQRDEKIKQILK